MAYVTWIRDLGISLPKWPCKHGSPRNRECREETHGKYLENDLQTPDKWY